MTSDLAALRAEIAERLQAQSWLDDPMAGFVDVDGFQSGSPVWPDERWVGIEDRGRFSNDRRDVWLFDFVREGVEPLRVPVGFVWDMSGDDARARVYYNKAHFGSAEPRRPVVAPEGGRLPAALARYVAAMRSGDGERIAAVVDPEAEFMSPIGPITGAQFIQAFSQPPAPGEAPGVPLQVCTVTSSGGRYAVEFISWRRPPHGGLGVYEFTGGKLTSIGVFEGPVRR